MGDPDNPQKEPNYDNFHSQAKVPARKRDRAKGHEDAQHRDAPFYPIEERMKGSPGQDVAKCSIHLNTTHNLPPTTHSSSTSLWVRTGFAGRTSGWGLGSSRGLASPPSRRRPSRSPVALGRSVGSRRRRTHPAGRSSSSLGRPEENVRIIALKDLNVDDVDMLTIVMIGSSASKVIQSGDLSAGANGKWVYTPRGYAKKLEHS